VCFNRTEVSVSRYVIFKEETSIPFEITGVNFTKEKEETCAESVIENEKGNSDEDENLNEDA